ncbi:MAG: 2-hydroxyacid dehydrogenase [Candidatus Njordarchaeota archaeon]
MAKSLLVTYKTREEDREIIESTLGSILNIFYLERIQEKELLGVARKINIILTGSGLDIPIAILQEMANLELIQTLSAGVEYVPMGKIPKKIIVCSNSGANAQVVAEHAFALILNAAKKVLYHDQNMRKGIWKRRDYGRALFDKTIGIIGLGNIGKIIAKIAKCLGMKIFAINRSGKTEVDVDFIGTIDDLKYVLENSDIIVICLPLTKHTYNLIGKKELEYMKPNTILVNIARGPIIDQKALYSHLVKNKEFVACLDVWWKYPDKGSDVCFQDFPFHELPNVIMTPHIAGFAREIRKKVILHAVLNIKRYVEGKKPNNMINIGDYL